MYTHSLPLSPSPTPLPNKHSCPGCDGARLWRKLMTLCNVRNVLHRNVFPYVGGGKGNDSSSPLPPASSIYLPTPHTFFDALFAYLPTHALRHSVRFLLGVCIFRSRKWVTCRLLTFPHTFFGTRCALFSVYVYSGCASG